MPSGWNAFGERAPPIPRDWRRSCSTPVRRFMWRELPARSPKGSGARARWSHRGGRGRGSLHCQKQPLVFPDDAAHHALDDDVALIQPERLHLVVGRLQPDPPAGLAVKPLHRGSLTIDQGKHSLAGLGLVAFLNDDVVAVLDVLVDHRIAAHLEDVAAPASRQQLVGYGDRLVTRDRLDRSTGGDQPEQRQLRGPGLPLGRDDFDRPALVVRAPDVPFALEIGEVLVNGRQRLEAKLAGNLLEAGGVPLLFDVLPDVVEDLALASRDRHFGSLAPEDIPNTNLPE